MFSFGFGMAFVAKAQQKIINLCTSKSRSLELHFTMSVFLLAASLDFQLYWRALPSFPVLANTGYRYVYTILYTLEEGPPLGEHQLRAGDGSNFCSP